MMLLMFDPRFPPSSYQCSSCHWQKLGNPDFASFVPVQTSQIQLDVSDLQIGSTNS